MEKITKVVWLCHFANEEIKEYFKTPHVNETAPWIYNLIKLFRSRKDIELHIVAPNIFNNRDRYILKGDVHYYFYSFRPKIIPKILFLILEKFFSTNYHIIQNKVASIIREINPEIIHLHGAENPYYSSAIIPLIGTYPILLTIQGFARNSSKTDIKTQKCIRIEEEIITKINHIAVRTIEMRNLVLSLNPSSQLHYHHYPVTVPQYHKKDDSTFDIIYFARVSKDKGIEDLLQALAMLKEENKDISLHIIGSCGMLYKKHLHRLIKTLGIKSNVVWVGFKKNHNDIFLYATNAKICVLPTYHDVIPGTIIESMFMKIPVIAYSVGGIPELNNTEETILLVEKHNISLLAERISQLLNDTNLQRTLSERAYSHVIDFIDNNKVVVDIYEAYNSILIEKAI